MKLLGGIIIVVIGASIYFLTKKREEDAQHTAKEHIISADSGEATIIDGEIANHNSNGEELSNSDSLEMAIENLAGNKSEAQEVIKMRHQEAAKTMESAMDKIFDEGAGDNVVSENEETLKRMSDELDDLLNS